MERFQRIFNIGGTFNNNNARNSANAKTVRVVVSCIRLTPTLLLLDLSPRARSFKSFSSDEAKVMSLVFLRNQIFLFATVFNRQKPWRSLSLTRSDVLNPSLQKCLHMVFWSRFLLTKTRLSHSLRPAKNVYLFIQRPSNRSRKESRAGNQQKEKRKRVRITREVEP